jgi:imidazolonepropionase-like amidohydrolase
MPKVKPKWLARKLSILVLILVTLVAVSPHRAKAQTQTLVIEGGTLIDGTGRDPIRDAVIVVEGSRIKAVGARGSVSVPAQATVIRAAGKTILPGLIDGHIHFLDFMPPMFLHFGVTTVVDTANPTEWIVAQREALRKGRIKGPRLFTTGWVIDGPIERANMLHSTERGGYRTHVSTTEEARVVVRNTIRQGVDAVKVHEGLTPELLAAVVDEAHKAGLEVVGHAEDAREATLAGFRFAEHQYSITHTTVRGQVQTNAPEADMDPALFDPLVSLMVEKGVYYNPTLSRSAINYLPKKREWEQLALAYLENPAWRFIPEARRELWIREAKAPARAVSPALAERRNQARLRIEDFVERYARAGGKFVAGPDTGPSSGPSNIPGLSLHLEMEALVDAGLTPMQAILASTKWTAEMLRKEKDLGTVEAGKLADLIVIDGDPLADIRATRRIQTVILDGKVVDTAVDPNFRNPMPRPVAAEYPPEYMGPEISDIAPRIGRQGDAGVTLDLTGEKFSPRSIVRFDTTDLATRFISESKLSATIPQGLLRNVGTYAVTVVTPGSGGGTSEVKYFVVNFPE